MSETESLPVQVWFSTLTFVGTLASGVCTILLLIFFTCNKRDAAGPICFLDACLVLDADTIFANLCASFFEDTFFIVSESNNVKNDLFSTSTYYTEDVR